MENMNQDEHDIYAYYNKGQSLGSYMERARHYSSNSHLWREKLPNVINTLIEKYKGGEITKNEILDKIEKLMKMAMTAREYLKPSPQNKLGECSAKSLVQSLKGDWPKGMSRDKVIKLLDSDARASEIKSDEDAFQTLLSILTSKEHEEREIGAIKRFLTGVLKEGSNNTFIERADPPVLLNRDKVEAGIEEAIDKISEILEPGTAERWKSDVRKLVDDQAERKEQESSPEGLETEHTEVPIGGAPELKESNANDEDEEELTGMVIVLEGPPKEIGIHRDLLFKRIQDGSPEGVYGPLLLAWAVTKDEGKYIKLSEFYKSLWVVTTGLLSDREMTFLEKITENAKRYLESQTNITGDYFRNTIEQIQRAQTDAGKVRESAREELIADAIRLNFELRKDSIQDLSDEIAKLQHCLRLLYLPLSSHRQILKKLIDSYAKDNKDWLGVSPDELNRKVEQGQTEEPASGETSKTVSEGQTVRNLIKTFLTPQDAQTAEIEVHTALLDQIIQEIPDDKKEAARAKLETARAVISAVNNVAQEMDTELKRNKTDPVPIHTSDDPGTAFKDIQKSLGEAILYRGKRFTIDNHILESTGDRGECKKGELRSLMKAIGFGELEQQGGSVSPNGESTGLTLLDRGGDQVIIPTEVSLQERNILQGDQAPERSLSQNILNSLYLMRDQKITTPVRFITPVSGLGSQHHTAYQIILSADIKPGQLEQIEESLNDRHQKIRERYNERYSNLGIPVADHKKLTQEYNDLPQSSAIKLSKISEEEYIELQTYLSTIPELQEVKDKWQTLKGEGATEDDKKDCDIIKTTHREEATRSTESRISCAQQAIIGELTGPSEIEMFKPLILWAEEIDSILPHKGKRQQHNSYDHECTRYSLSNCLALAHLGSARKAYDQQMICLRKGFKDRDEENIGIKEKVHPRKIAADGRTVDEMTAAENRAAEGAETYKYSKAQLPSPTQGNLDVYKKILRVRADIGKEPFTEDEWGEFNKAEQRFKDEIDTLLKDLNYKLPERATLASCNDSQTTLIARSPTLDKVKTPRQARDTETKPVRGWHTLAEIRQIEQDSRYKKSTTDVSINSDAKGGFSITRVIRKPNPSISYEELELRFRVTRNGEPSTFSELYDALVNKATNKTTGQLNLEAVFRDFFIRAKGTENVQKLISSAQHTRDELIGKNESVILEYLSQSFAKQMIKANEGATAEHLETQVHIGGLALRLMGPRVKECGRRLSRPQQTDTGHSRS